MKLPTDQETQAVLPALDPTQFLQNRLLTTLGSDETHSAARCPEDWWPDRGAHHLGDEDNARTGSGLQSQH